MLVAILGLGLGTLMIVLVGIYLLLVS